MKVCRAQNSETEHFAEGFATVFAAGFCIGTALYHFEI